MNRNYCPFRSEDPEPLRMTVASPIRFEEVDPLGIVWHGRYASLFDDARVALGNAFGFGYLDLLDHKVLTPIRKFHADYLYPLSYPETAFVEVLLHWTEAARLDHEFIVRNAEQMIVATGYSVQMMLDADKRVMMIPPPFIVEIRERWRAGTLEKIDPEEHEVLARRRTAWSQ